MDLLKAELSKKRKLLENNSLITNEKKYFRRQELIQIEEEEYLKRQAEKELKKRDNEEDNNNDINESFNQNDITNLDQIGKTPEEIANLKLKQFISIHSKASTSDTKNINEDERIMPRKDVIKKLRDRNEPILLFGEGEIEAFRRLRKLEILEPDATDKGLRNDFQVFYFRDSLYYLTLFNFGVFSFQEAMEKVDAAYLQEIVKSGSSGSTRDGDKKKGAHDVKFEEMNTTIEQILDDAEYLGKQRKKGPENESTIMPKSDCHVILKFLKYLLELWGRKLNDRSESEKRSTQGKIVTAIYTQTQNYLKPLFKTLIKETVADDILKHLILIIKLMLERNYVKANDAYLQMAIGNAPWPIGVTMVGIHARTGREKIFAQNIAHVLNDETQRKYIQALKRLMTQCQKMFPTDPSRCVEYVRE